MKEYEILPSGVRLYCACGVFGITTDSLLLARFAQIKKNAKIADLGCGSGFLGFYFSERAGKALLVDILREAADIAAKTAMENGLSDKYTVICTDISEILSDNNGCFDTVIMNPPYYVNADTECNDARNGNIGDFVSTAARLLKNGGKLFTVFPASRAAELITVCSNAGLETKRICFVKKSEKVAPRLILTEASKGAAPGCRYECDIVGTDIVEE